MWPGSGPQLIKKRRPSNRGVLVGTIVLVACMGVAGFFLLRESGDQGNDNVYVALGASDAVGIGASRPSTDGWVPLVHDSLDADARLVNLGISGASVEEILFQEVPVAVAAEPSLVTIWPGVNDLRDGTDLATFEIVLKQILEEFSSSTTQIIVANIPDLRFLPAFAAVDPVELDTMVKDWNTAISRVALAHRAIVVDLYSSSFELDAHPEYVSQDGFHPSSAGYRRIADLAIAAIGGS